MLDVYLPMMRCAAILAAGQLGIFARLADGPKSAAALAKSLRVDPDALARLLLALQDAGYVARRPGKQWANTGHATRWFTANGRVDYTAGLQWTADAIQLMAGLEGVVRRGGPEQPIWALLQERPEAGRRFARYMHAFACHSSPAITRHVELPVGARRILDIGGSHGLHSINLCRRYPDLSSTILDHTSALTDTDRIVREHGLEHRITTVAGDWRDTTLPRRLDAVLLFSVAHNLAPADNARLFRRIAGALSPGGLLVMHDYLPGAMPRVYQRLFDLTLLTEVGTRTYRRGEFQSWASGAGFGRLRVRHLEPREMGSVMLARLGTGR